MTTLIHIVLVLILLERTEWLPSTCFAILAANLIDVDSIWSTKSLNYWTLSSRNLMICFLGCRMYLVVVVTKDHQAWHEVAAQKIQLVSASFHTPKS